MANLRAQILAELGAKPTIDAAGRDPQARSTSSRTTCGRPRPRDSSSGSAAARTAPWPAGSRQLAGERAARRGPRRRVRRGAAALRRAGRRARRADRARASSSPTGRSSVNVKPGADAVAAESRRGAARDHRRRRRTARLRARQHQGPRAHGDPVRDRRPARAYLVVGTDHAAEAVTGFFTKFGDGGVDITPLTGLTKRQGAALLQELGAPRAPGRRSPPPTSRTTGPRLPDEEALGLTTPRSTTTWRARTSPRRWPQKLESIYLDTRHKRTVPVTPLDTGGGDPMARRWSRAAPALRARRWSRSSARAGTPSGS